MSLTVRAEFLTTVLPIVSQYGTADFQAYLEDGVYAVNLTEFDGDNLKPTDEEIAFVEDKFPTATFEKEYITEWDDTPYPAFVLHGENI